MLAPNTLISSITALAAVMAQDKSTDEINLLGAIFTQLGDTLSTIASAKDFADSKSS